MDGSDSPPFAESGSFFSPLLGSVLGIGALSVAIVLYQFVVVKYCLRRRRQTTDAAAELHFATGLDKRVLDDIPIFVFSALKSYRLQSDQEECVVCLGEFEDEEMVRILPNCKHSFHVQCIDRWFSAHTSCPLCRTPLILQQRSNQEYSTPARSTGGSGMESESTISGDEPTSPADLSSTGLRQCTSLNLPPQRLLAKLKRSLSMDQSSLLVDIPKGGRINDCSRASSSSSIPSRKRKTIDYCRTRSMDQFDNASSKLMRSFSRLRDGKNNGIPILPY